MLRDMVLPSTVNEKILSMADVECRDNLYRSGLKTTYVEFWLLNKCTCKKKCEKMTGNCERQQETELTIVHRQRAFEKGFFKKDKHRSFRIQLHMIKQSHRKHPKTF